MRGRDLVKVSLEIVTSLGVGAIVGNVVRATAPSVVSVPIRICTIVGSAMLGGMAGEIVGNWTGRKFDEILDGPSTQEQPRLVVVQ